MRSVKFPVRSPGLVFAHRKCPEASEAQVNQDNFHEVWAHPSLVPLSAGDHRGKGSIHIFNDLMESVLPIVAWFSALAIPYGCFCYCIFPVSF